MMFGLAYLRIVAVLGPIALLLAVGFWLTLRSGVVSLSSGSGLRRAVGNLSQTILLVGCCLFGLVVLQEIVGFRLGLGLR